MMFEALICLPAVFHYDGHFTNVLLYNRDEGCRVPIVGLSLGCFRKWHDHLLVSTALYSPEDPNMNCVTASVILPFAPVSFVSFYNYSWSSDRILGLGPGEHHFGTKRSPINARLPTYPRGFFYSFMTEIFLKPLIHVADDLPWLYFGLRQKCPSEIRNFIATSFPFISDFIRDGSRASPNPRSINLAINIAFWVNDASGGDTVIPQ